MGDPRRRTMVWAGPLGVAGLLVFGCTATGSSSHTPTPEVEGEAEGAEGEGEGRSPLELDGGEPTEADGSGPLEADGGEGDQADRGATGPCTTDRDCGAQQVCFEHVCLADADGDDVADVHDNCKELANPDQADADGDGLGDACRAPVVDDCGQNVPAAGHLAFGGGCGPTPDCHPASLTYPDCLNEPCQAHAGPDGLCWGDFCTRRCTAPTDCQPGPGRAWVDGPRGAAYACYGNQQLGVCLPGSLTECADDQACAPGEVCQISYSRDFRHLTGLCLVARKCGAQPGEPCNEDPLTGPLQRCENGLCYGDRCNTLCTRHEQCDWSPGLECQPLELAGQTALSHCATPVPAQVHPGCGEPCNEDPLDELPDVPCAAGVCLNSVGRCVCSCQAEADCAEGQACLPTSICLGELVDGRCTGDSALIGFCQEWAGSRAPCQVDGDCPAGEHCSLFAHDPATANLDLRCQADTPDGAGLGEECGGPQELDCANTEFCMTDGDPAASGYCSRFCRSDADCGDDLHCAEYPVTDEVTVNLCLR